MIELNKIIQWLPEHRQLEKERAKVLINISVIGFYYIMFYDQGQPQLGHLQVQQQNIQRNTQIAQLNIMIIQQEHHQVIKVYTRDTEKDMDTTNMVSNHLYQVESR